MVHDVLTLATVSASVLVEGEPEVEHSWFEGYAWQCAYCASCGQHVGWAFSSAPGRPTLQPSSFFGLRRPALQAGGSRDPSSPAGARAYLRGGDGGWTSSEDEDEESSGGSPVPASEGDAESG